MTEHDKHQEEAAQPWELRRELPPVAPAQPPADVLIQPPDEVRTNRWLAALSAAGFRYRLGNGPDGWGIYVPARRADAARAEIAEYERVNQNWPPRTGMPLPALVAQTPAAWSSAFVAALLVLAYFVIGSGTNRTPLFESGTAAARQIAEGQWWRTATALTLHMDVPHLAANTLCVFFIGSAAARHAGSGVAWALILLSGILGNLSAVHFGGATWTAAGASTAVFGALGMVTVFQSVRNYRQHGNLRSVWSRAWIPGAAGVAILSWLGTSPGSDLLGHFYGFLWGLACALPFALRAGPPPPPLVQGLAALGAAATLSGCWLLVLLHA